MKNVLLNPTYRTSFSSDPDAILALAKNKKHYYPMLPKPGIVTIPLGDELKCSAILPSIAPSKRHEGNADRKRSLSKDYRRPNPRLLRKPKGGHFHNSIKTIKPHPITTEDIIQDYIASKLGGSRGTSADYPLSNSIERNGEAQGTVPLETSAEETTLVPLKKLNPEMKLASARLSEYQEKLSTCTESGCEKSEPKLILCDEQGYSFRDLPLDDFLENRQPDHEVFKDYFVKVISPQGKSLEHKSSADPIINIKSLHPADNGTDLDDSPKKPRTNSLAKYNKVMKEVDLKYKKYVLGQIIKSLPEPYLNKARTLHNSLEVLTDKQNNVVIRVKRKGRFKPHNTTDTIVSPKKAVWPQAKKVPPAEGENEETKVNFVKKGKRAGIDLTKEGAEESDLSRVSLRNYVSHKPVTTIKVLHKDYDHLSNHPVNQAITLMNRFISLTFKNKENVFDINTIFKMAKAMKLNLAKKAINSTTFRNREIAYGLKEQLTKYLSSVINHSNGFGPPSEALPKGAQYKFFVGKGNNGIMVRSILKQRWWWNYGTRHDENLSLLWTQWCKSKYISELPCFGKLTAETQLKITNHFERHYHLSNKKAMFINLQRYYQMNGQDPFLTLPLTFHIREGVGDPEFAKFAEYYTKLQKDRKKTPEGKKQKPERNVWIIKPGEYSNRGSGITVMQEFDEIKRLIGSTGKRPHTYILQKYIEKPLLINKRKFDIRMYGMLTSVNGVIKGYFYEEGYIRTSCKEYSLKNLANKAVHLTNDAVQKKEDDYGKYENGNKMSFADFQKYLDANYASLNIDFFRDLLPQIKVCYGEKRGIENHNRYVQSRVQYNRPL